MHLRSGLGRLVASLALAGALVGLGCASGDRITDEGDDDNDDSASASDTDSGTAGGTDDTGDTDDTDDGPNTDPGDGTCAHPGTSNLGCEFWAVDLPNVSQAPLATVPHNQQFAVVVTNTSAASLATVSVYSGAGTTALVTVQVPVGDIATIPLPTQNITPGATTSTGVAFRIESDVPIAAYQFNPLDNTSAVYSNDASLLLPTHVLSKDYAATTGAANIVAADGFSVSDKNTGGFVAVVATEDNTLVTLYPTAALYAGAYQGVILNRGQVLTAISSGKKAAGNLSGTRVVADKKVAVFGGSVATSEPSNTTECCADHVEHQMLPLEAWGNTYAVPPAADAKSNGDCGSLYRITAGYDGTTFSYSPAAPTGAPTTLGAYEMAEFRTSEPFVVTSTDPEKTFSVTQFLLSNQLFGGAFDTYPGDPSMIVLPTIDQFQNTYVFLVPAGYNINFVTVVRAGGQTVTLDGVAVTEAFAALGTFDGTEYQYAHLELTTGQHVIESDAPLSITVVGYSPDVSYGYPGGSGVAQIADIPDPPV